MQNFFFEFICNQRVRPVFGQFYIIPAMMRIKEAREAQKKSGLIMGFVLGCFFAEP